MILNDNARVVPTQQKAAGRAVSCEADTPHRILAVHVDGDRRFLNAEALKRTGYQVDAAEDGEAGWKTIQRFVDASTSALRLFTAFLKGRARSGLGFTILFYICFASFLSLNVGAGVLVPSFYAATPEEGITQGGTYNYFDDTGSQLIDAVYGADNWQADLGNGRAYEWTGWRVANPVILFYFPELVTISQVGINFNRTEPVALIYLPSMVNIGGTDFTVAANMIPDGTAGMLNFRGSWTGSTLTVTLTDNDPNRWTFLDQITFDGVAVPEPSGLLLAIGALGFLARNGRGNPFRDPSRFRKTDEGGF
jgi:hypothetical protein